MTWKFLQGRIVPPKMPPGPLLRKIHPLETEELIPNLIWNLRVNFRAPLLMLLTFVGNEVGISFLLMFFKHS